MKIASSDPDPVKLVGALARQRARRAYADNPVARTMSVADGSALAVTQGVNPLVQAV
jgi:hypothetical protein